jgi:hypothetical protein
MPRPLLLLLILPATASCFTYQEVGSASLGDQARIMLPVMDRNEEGEDEPIFTEGVVVANESGITLEQERVEEAGLFRRVEFFDTVYVPQTDIRTLEVRRLSWTRTILGSAALAFVVQAAYSAFRDANR